MQSLIKNKSLIFSLMSGLLLILIFPRFDLEFLAWFALIPLLQAIQDQPHSKAAVYGFFTGLVFYFFGLHWITNTLVNYGNIPPVVSYPILALLSAYMAFFLALFCYLVRRLSRGNPVYAFILAPFIWTSLEYLRSTHGTYGFSWLGLGYSQFLNLPIIQMAEYTGVYGISTLIILVNAGLNYLLSAYFADPNRGHLYPAHLNKRVIGITAGAFLVCLVYGYTVLPFHGKGSEKDGVQKLKIGLAQGNIEQNQKWNPEYRTHVLNTYRNMTLESAKAEPDLIVWPEAAIPFFFLLEQKETLWLKNLVREAKTPLLFGSPRQVSTDKGPVLFNSAYLAMPDGTVPGRYDKIHLVPFGEFVPFKKVLWFVDKMVEGIGNFKGGEEATVFKVNGVPFGVSICYEITFPNLVREPVSKGARFLVNITNDAWFGYSAASYQHIGMAALRAVENRVPIVRAANTGITGMIQPTGEIKNQTQLFVQNLVLTTIAARESRPTYYAKYGDIFSYACLLLWGILSLLARRGSTP